MMVSDHQVKHIYIYIAGVAYRISCVHPCILDMSIDLSIDAMDVSGEHQLDVLHSIYKQRLTPEGQPINEKPEEIKLGAEHEDEQEGAAGEENKDGAAKREGEGKPAEENKQVAKKEDVCGR